MKRILIAIFAGFLLTMTSSCTTTPKPTGHYNIEDEITIIDIKDAYKIWQSKKAHFIDARSTRLFKIDHIPSAINIPCGYIQPYWEKFKQQSTPNDMLIIYCSSENCKSGKVVVQFLKSKDYKNINIFKGGIIAWENNNYPLEKP